jgi:exonuclease SbcC
MIPLNLHLSGFLSYDQAVDLDFRGFDLACISGANGAGKSSLLDAITWVLFGQARRKDDTIINSHAKKAEVILDFEYENNVYRVRRTKQPNKATVLEFTVRQPDGSFKPLTEHTVAKTEERIVQVLRMDYDTFTNASFFLQGRADQFSQQTPTERKRILGNILGLEKWEEMRQATIDQRRSAENELIGLESQLEEIKSELAESDQRHSSLKQLEDSLKSAAKLREQKEQSLEMLHRQEATIKEQKRLVDLLAGQAAAGRQRLDDTTAKMAERRTEQDTYRQQVKHAAKIEAAYQNWLALRKELEHWEEVAASFRQHEQRRAAPLTAIESEKARLEQERSGLLEQQRQIDDISDALPQAEAQIKEKQTALVLLVNRLDERAHLEEEQRSQIEALGACAAENRQLKGDMEALRERIDQLDATEGATCPVCGQPLSPKDRSKLIKDLKQQGKDMGDHYRQNLAKTQEGEQRRTELENELASLQQVESDRQKQQRGLDQMENQFRQAQSAVDAWQSTGAQRLAEVTARLKNEDYAAEARRQLAEADAALKELGYDAAAHDACRRREQESRTSEEQFRSLEKARSALEPLEREIASLKQQRSEQEKEVEKQEAEHQLAATKYEEIAASLPDLTQADGELYQLREDENRLRMEVGAAKQKVAVLKDLRTREAEIKEHGSTIKLRIARLKTLEHAFGKDGIPALLIEQALPEIEAQANALLDRLSPNGMSVHFETQKDYKAKNREDRKETLDILISDPMGQREYELYSGGEAFRVNFAIRLALSHLLAQRAGARLQTLVIDEGFGSQDADGRQRLIEAINLVQPDFAKILVITHLEELKDAFPARIEVEKTPQGSRVTVVAV